MRRSHARVNHQCSIHPAAGRGRASCQHVEESQSDRPLNDPTRAAAGRGGPPSANIALTTWAFISPLGLRIGSAGSRWRRRSREINRESRDFGAERMMLIKLILVMYKLYYTLHVGEIKYVQKIR